MAQLKQLVDRPDVVEMHVVTAQDPKLLVHLKVGGECVQMCLCVCAYVGVGLCGCGSEKGDMCCACSTA